MPRPRARAAAEVAAGGACGAEAGPADDPGGEFHMIGVLEILGAFFFSPVTPEVTTSILCPASVPVGGCSEVVTASSVFSSEGTAVGDFEVPKIPALLDALPMAAGPPKTGAEPNAGGVFVAPPKRAENKAI